MIYGNINVAETKCAYSQTLTKALELLRTMDVSDKPAGKYPLDGDKMFMMINEYTTQPKPERRAEIHQKYVDIQYMIHGQEYIGCYPKSGEDEVTEDRMESGDICFFKYKDTPKEVMLPMMDGDYAILFPEDVHRPGCQMGEPCAVRKIVMKIAVDTL